MKSIALPLGAALVAAAYAVASCVGDEPAFPGAPDGGAGDGSTPDGGVAPAACDLEAPFGRLTNVAELNTPTDDESARLSQDQLTVYFSRRGGPKPGEGAFFVLSASRGSIDDAFGVVTQLALRLDSSGPSVNGARTTLYFAADTDAGPDLYAARVPFTGATSTSLGKLNTASWEFTPYARPDDMELYFSTNRLGSDDIYVAPRVNGDLVTPTNILAVNTDKSERTPVITPDGLTLYFASDRSGSFDVFVSKRKGVGEAFGAPTPVAELNGPTHEQPDWIAPDGCTLYFRSDRAEDGGKGGKDIWRASRPAPP